MGAHLFSPRTNAAFFVALVAGTVATSGVRTVAAAVRGRLSCTAGYAYAGVSGWTPARGVEATISVAVTPVVAAGHVAAWVGVGGKHLGPGGTDEWIQAGLSDVPGRGGEVYAEIATAAQGPVYTQVAPVVAGKSYRIAIVGLPGSRWEARVNGRIVAGPVELPHSSAWQPVATAESWLPAPSDCNRFAYRFDSVSELGARTRSWRALRSPAIFADRPYRVRRSGSSFIAATGSVVSTDVTRPG